MINFHYFEITYSLLIGDRGTFRLTVCGHAKFAIVNLGSARSTYPLLAKCDSTEVRWRVAADGVYSCGSFLVTLLKSMLCAAFLIRKYHSNCSKHFARSCIYQL